MRDLAREIVRNAVESKPGCSPTLADLYFFLLRCLQNDATAAEGALADYLECKNLEQLRSCVQKALSNAVAISE